MVRIECLNATITVGTKMTERIHVYKFSYEGSHLTPVKTADVSIWHMYEQVTSATFNCREIHFLRLFL